VVGVGVGLRVPLGPPSMGVGLVVGVTVSTTVSSSVWAFVGVFVGGVHVRRGSSGCIGWWARRTRWTLRISSSITFVVTEDVPKEVVHEARILSNVDGSFSSFTCSNAGSFSSFTCSSACQVALIWIRTLAQRSFAHTCANSSEADPPSKVAKVETPQTFCCPLVRQLLRVNRRSR
jgi:hypothetical protein